MAEHEVQISTVVADNLDIVAVCFQIGDRKDILLPDAAAKIALELLAASYGARAEQTLINYAKKHGLTDMRLA